jgi:hypothetical protein
MAIYVSKPLSQRGALACMEFTGNVFGYASSVVSKMSLCLTRQLVDRLIIVVGLLLLVY